MKPRDAETSLEREFDQHFDLPTIRSVTPGRPFAWLALGAIGTGVQLGFTGGEKGRVGRRNPVVRRRKKT